MTKFKNGITLGRMVSEAASALGSLLEREVLPLVAKPHRYVGHELGAVSKDWDAAKVRFLFCYPDVYEVGMSHTGTQMPTTGRRSRPTYSRRHSRCHGTSCPSFTFTGRTSAWGRRDAARRVRGDRRRQIS